MRTDFPRAPDPLPTEMTELLRRLAVLWAREPSRARPTFELVEHWDRLINDWTSDLSLPFYIRKYNDNRGSILSHSSGRSLVPVDNSPAQWAFAQAVLGERPSLDDVRHLIAADKVPVAMMLRPKERAAATYSCTLGKAVNPNTYGWKVAHVDAVGLSSRSDILDLPADVLESHFRKLMAPRNMFAIPLRYTGLGELPEFRDAIRAILTLA